MEDDGNSVGVYEGASVLGPPFRFLPCAADSIPGRTLRDRCSMECAAAKFRGRRVVIVGSLRIGKATRLVTGHLPISSHRDAAFDDDTVVAGPIRVSFLSPLYRLGVSNARQWTARSEHTVCFCFAARVDDWPVRRPRHVRRRLTTRAATDFDITDGDRKLAIVVTCWITCVRLPRSIGTNI